MIKFYRYTSILTFIVMIIAYICYRIGYILHSKNFIDLLMVLVLLNVSFTVLLSISKKIRQSDVEAVNKKRSALKEDIRRLKKQKKIMTYVRDRVELFDERKRLKRDILAILKKQKHLYTLLEDFEKKTDDLYWNHYRVDDELMSLKRIVDEEGLRKEFNRRRIPFTERAIKIFEDLFY